MLRQRENEKERREKNERAVNSVYAKGVSNDENDQ